MEHPIRENRENQARFLEEIEEGQRPFHAQLFRLGNAAYIYHARSDEFEPTKIDFTEWLGGLPTNIRKDMEIKGFELCKGVLSFSRYVMEKNDIGMTEWMKQNLNEKDFKKFSRK